MSKLSLFLLIAALAYCTAFSSFDSDSDESDSDWDSDEDNDWPKMHFPEIRIPNIHIPKMHIQKMKHIKPDDIKNLKPDGPNSEVDGAFTSMSSTIKMVDGKVVQNEKKASFGKNVNGKYWGWSSGGDKQ